MLKIEEQLCYGSDFTLSNPVTAVSSRDIAKACRNGAKLRVSVLPGQTMNISVFDFNSRQMSYLGSIVDVVSTNEEEITGGMRFQEVMKTVGNKIDINYNQELPSSANFVILLQSKINNNTNPPC